jgi:carboxylesterase type B
MRDGFESEIRVHRPKESPDKNSGGGGSPLVVLLYGGGFFMGKYLLSTNPDLTDQRDENNA